MAPKTCANFHNNPADKNLNAMFKWKKMGRIFDPTQLKNSWMKEYAQAPSVIVFDDYIRVFFSSRDFPDNNGNYISRLAYIDLSRNNLFSVVNVCKEPILALGKLGTFDEFGTYPASTIRINDEIRVYYAGWTRCESVPFNAAIGLAISYDHGNSFTRLGDGPVLSYSLDEPFVLGSPKIRQFNDTWYLWYSAGKKWVNHNGTLQPVYKIRMATSSDGIHWHKVGKDLIDDVLEDTECQASPDVFFFDGKYHMQFSYRYNINFKTQDRGYRIGYASSTDLINWIRDDSKVSIEKSEYGWDSESVSYPYVFQIDNNLYMLYQGNEMGRYGFGLAKLGTHN